MDPASHILCFIRHGFIVLVRVAVVVHVEVVEVVALSLGILRVSDIALDSVDYGEENAKESLHNQDVVDAHVDELVDVADFELLLLGIPHDFGVESGVDHYPNHPFNVFQSATPKEEVLMS